MGGHGALASAFFAMMTAQGRNLNWNGNVRCASRDINRLENRCRQKLN